jgi:hypothetical protein
VECWLCSIQAVATRHWARTLRSCGDLADRQPEGVRPPVQVLMHEAEAPIPTCWSLQDSHRSMECLQHVGVRDGQASRMGRGQTPHVSSHGGPREGGHLVPDRKSSAFLHGASQKVGGSRRWTLGVKANIRLPSLYHHQEGGCPWPGVGGGSSITPHPSQPL